MMGKAPAVARGYPGGRLRASNPSTITRSFQASRSSPPPVVSSGRRAVIVGNTVGSSPAWTVP